MKKIKPSALQQCCVVCLLAATSLLEGSPLAEGPGDIVSLTLRSPHERAGNYDALAASWLETITQTADDFRTELTARRLSGSIRFLSDPQALTQGVEKALEVAYTNGVTREVLVDILATLYRKAGREEDRQRLDAGRGFLREWLIVGPFGKGKSSLFLQQFPPETEPTTGAEEYLDDWQRLSWRKVERKGPDPLVRPFDYVFPKTGVTYLLSQIRSQKEVEAVLQLRTSASIQIWLNGTLVVDDNVHSAALENRRAAGVRLTEGWNRVLVKSAHPFWIRLCDSSGNRLPEGLLAEESGEELHAITATHDPRRLDTFQVGALRQWAAWVAELEERNEATADAHLALAMLYQTYGRSPLAVAQVEKALKLSPEDAMALYHAGNITRHAGYLPSTISKNRSQSAFEAALVSDPSLVPAYERLARYLEQDEKYAQAALKVEEGLAIAPTFLRGLYRLHSIFSERSWTAQAQEVMRRIEAIAPRSSVPSVFWARHYKRLGNLSEAVSRYREALEVDHGRADLFQALGSVELRRGNVKEAEAAYREALRLEPEETSYEKSFIHFLAEGDRLDEALQRARGLAQRRPLDPVRKRLVAALLDRQRQKEEALDTYKRALELDPGNLSLKRYLSFRQQSPPAKPQEAGPDSFWTPYDEELEDWLLQVPEEGPFVDKAASIIVLDLLVLRLEPDGSYCEYVHQAFKLLTEESKEDLAKVNIPGEVLLLRTLTPRGETLEPVAAEGRGSYVMPGLERGAFIEFAYRNDHRRRGDLFSNGPFFFQDLNFRQSFLLSRYAVILPEGFDVGFLENNLEGPARRGGVDFAHVEKTVRELDDGSTVVLYEARRVPRLEQERSMPTTTEYIPNIELRKKQSWTDIASRKRAIYAGRTLPTPELEEVARQATRGIDDPIARARALYDHVNEIIPSRGSARSAVGVLLEKSGDRNVLFKALLDIAGVPARWAFLRPREAMMARADWSYPQGGLFQYPHVVVEVEGEEPHYVSLTHRKTPFARLPEHLEGGKALLMGEQGESITHLPSPRPEESATSLRGTLLLGDSMDVEANAVFTLHSISAHGQKDRLKTIPDFQKKQILSRMASQMFAGARVKKAEMPGLEDPDQPLAFKLALTAPKMLRKSGEDFLLKPTVQPSNMVKSFAGRSTREHPLHFRSQRISRDSLRIEAGEHYRLHHTPRNVLLPSALGTYTLTYTVSENSVLVERELTLLPGRLSAEEFPAFEEFCEKVDAAERESVVFHPRT